MPLFDPDRPIREILRDGSYLFTVEDAQDEYAYAYEQFGGASGNSHIIRAKTAGYEVVRGDMPENKDNRNEQGMCVVGDTMLLRIKKERHQKIQDEIGRIHRERRGEEKNDNMLENLNEQLSQALGRRVNVTFSYKDPAELSQRRR